MVSRTSGLHWNGSNQTLNHSGVSSIARLEMQLERILLPLQAIPTISKFKVSLQVRFSGNLVILSPNPSDNLGAHSVHQQLHRASYLQEGQVAPFQSAVLQSNAILYEYDHSVTTF